MNRKKGISKSSRRKNQYTLRCFNRSWDFYEKAWLGILATNQSERTVKMRLVLELPDAVVTFWESPGAGRTGPGRDGWIQLAHDIHRRRRDRLNI